MADLNLDLTREQRITLSREEIGSITEAGIRFEAVLEAGFALQIAQSSEPLDPRTTYLLHEIGEETRHQRLFLRMLEQIQPKAKNPFVNRSTRSSSNAASSGSLPSGTAVRLVLGGEEIPDLFQKLASEHPDTDSFIKQVNKYHRMEEARHLSFARARLPEVWAKASFIDRLAVRFVAPIIINGMFDTIVHPGVYATVGLPAMETWKRVRKSDTRLRWKAKATRPVLDAVIEAGAFGRVASPRAGASWSRASPSRSPRRSPSDPTARMCCVGGPLLDHLHTKFVGRWFIRRSPPATLGDMQVHLVDGTYELFRYFFALPSHVTADGREVAATRGVVGIGAADPRGGRHPRRRGHRPRHRVVPQRPLAPATRRARASTRAARRSSRWSRRC